MSIKVAWEASSMTNTLNILHLEDDRRDAELIKHDLQAAGIACQIVRVDDREDFASILERQPFDLILADNSMPGFDGTSALLLAHQMKPDTPFIFVTGTLGEEVAIESLKNGANDYVLKQHLSRLAPVVLRAMEEAGERKKRRQAETALRQSEERFRSLIENSSDAISLLGADGKLIYVSPSTERILGYSNEEVVGSDPVEVIHPEDQLQILTIIHEVVQKPGENFTAQYRVRHKNGSWRWIETSIQNMLANPNVEAIVFNYQDITERKQSEAEIQRRAAHQNALTAIITAATQASANMQNVLDVCLQHTLQAFELEMGMIWIDRGEYSSLNLSDEFVSAIIHTMRSHGLVVDQTRATFDWQHIPAEDPRQEIGILMAKYGIRADVVTPLQNGGHSLGGLSVISAQPRIWSDEEISLLDAIGRHLGIVIESVRLFEEAQHRLAELDAVNRVSTAMRAAQTLDELLPRLMDETLKVMNTEAGMLLLYNPTNNLLLEGIDRGFFELLPRGPMRPSEGIAGHVLSTGEAHITHEFASDPLTLESAREIMPAGWGGACVPIRTANEMIGVFFVSVQQPRTLSSEEVHVLQTVAEIAGNAIHRTRLFTQTENRLQQLIGLRMIDGAISSSLDRNAVLGTLLDQVIRQLQVDAADVLILSPTGNTLQCVEGRGFRQTEVENRPFDTSGACAGRVIRERQAVHVSKRLEFSSSRGERINSEGFVDYYGYPLIANNQLKGVLEIFHRSELHPDPDWVGFLETLAGQAGIAIEHLDLFDSLQRSNQELAQAYDATIEGWARMLDLRDKETEGHTRRVTELTLNLGGMMGLEMSTLAHMRRGALLHDIGKMGVPDRILLKPGPLDDEEWRIMRLHPVYAYEFLSPVSFLQPALAIPYSHHEKWDGSGYPRGLKGKQIPLEARIFAVVDVWDALNSDRPYRPAWPKEKILRHIQEQAGIHFDPEIVTTFIRKLFGTQEFQRIAG
jgi:PAS domain S-box-containing protein